MKIELFSPLYIHELGQRDNQEDSLWPLDATADNRLFVLCDGMGGHEHGEVASQIVCQSLGKWFQEHIDSNDSLSKDQVREAIEYAYVELDKYADGSPRQMGTTFTLLYIGKNGVTAAHMGDSRIYHLRPHTGVLYQSRDHSLVFDLFQAGEITYDEMATYPQKNMVTRAMTPGEDNRMRPDIIHITDIQQGDYFYMCSDGMLEQMENGKLISILSSNDTDDNKQKQLIEATKHNLDNHSAWMIHIKDVIKECGDVGLIDEERTARCNMAFSLPSEIYDNEDVVIVNKGKRNLFQRMRDLFK